jgi:hypothetical protein
MNWQPIYKQSGKPVKRILTDDEKKAWESHASTRGLFNYVQVNLEPVKRVEVQGPIGAGKFDPKALIERKKAKTNNNKSSKS